MTLLTELIDLIAETNVPALATPTIIAPEGVTAISFGLNALLANVFAVYMKTKNFHWHVSGQNFRDYHLMFDEHADQLYDMTDPIAERVRKLGSTTIRSIGHISELQRIQDNREDFVDPQAMMVELLKDNQLINIYLASVHQLCDTFKDFATASLLEVWMDETQRRIWFLFEASGIPNMPVEPAVDELLPVVASC